MLQEAQTATIGCTWATKIRKPEVLNLVKTTTSATQSPSHCKPSYWCYPLHSHFWKDSHAALHSSATRFSWSNLPSSRTCLLEPHSVLFFAPPKSIVQIYLWRSVKLFLPIRERRWIDHWPYFSTKVIDLLVTLLASLSAYHCWRTFQSSFQNSDNKIEHSFLGWSFPDIVRSEIPKSPRPHR